MAKNKKRLQKQEKREAEKRTDLFRERAARLRRQKLEEYPSFVVGKQDADPEFISAVMQAVRRYDFLDTAKLGVGFQAFLKLGKRHGFAWALKVLEAVPNIKTEKFTLEGNAKIAFAAAAIGSEILRNVAEAIRRRYMPFNDVEISPVGN